MVCDHAKRYLGAVALHSINAKHVAQELVHIFLRAGTAEEIHRSENQLHVTTIGEVYKLLKIKSIRTSPYHPQTDPLVEQMLKAMLRKTVTSEGKDWDALIPYVLFAYREVPQALTWFSPIELLYGRPVRVLLDML